MGLFLLRTMPKVVMMAIALCLIMMAEQGLANPASEAEESWQENPIEAVQAGLEPGAEVDRLQAYWDNGGCGPRGNDYRAGLCGGTTANPRCPSSQDASECPTGKAVLEMHGNGKRSSFVEKGCHYWYKAKYYCEGPRGCEMELRGSWERSTIQSQHVLKAKNVLTAEGSGEASVNSRFIASIQGKVKPLGYMGSGGLGFSAATQGQTDVLAEGFFRAVANAESTITYKSFDKPVTAYTWSIKAIQKKGVCFGGPRQVIAHPPGDPIYKSGGEASPNCLPQGCSNGNNCAWCKSTEFCLNKKQPGCQKPNLGRDLRELEQECFGKAGSGGVTARLKKVETDCAGIEQPSSPNPLKRIQAIMQILH